MINRSSGFLLYEVIIALLLFSVGQLALFSMELKALHFIQVSAQQTRLSMIQHNQYEALRVK